MLYTLKSSPKTGVIAYFRQEKETNAVVAISSKKKVTFALTHTSGDSKYLRNDVFPDMILPVSSGSEMSDFKRPKESGFLISDRFYNFIKEFALPPYRSFQVRFLISGEEVDNSHRLVVFESNLFEQVIPELTTYKLVARNNLKETIAIKKGYRTIEELKAARINYRERGLMMLVDQYRIKDDYDLWWGGDFFVYVSERLHKEMISVDFKGVDIRPFENFSILQADDYMT